MFKAGAFQGKIPKEGGDCLHRTDEVLWTKEEGNRVAKGTGNENDMGVDGNGRKFSLSHEEGKCA